MSAKIKTKRANKSADIKISDPGLADAGAFWYTERHDGHSGNTFKINRIIESTQSKFQRIDVVETAGLGKALILYGSLMVAEGDQNAYNEMLAHVPLFSHPKPEDVLIIGGGDCGCLTNVLKHPEVKRATMCELDKEVVEVSKRHFPRLTAGVKDKRAKLIFRDGKKFLETTRKKWDVILLDLSDPVGPAAELFQASFHRTIYERLKDDGTLVAQSESPFYNLDITASMYGNLANIFPQVHLYTCHMIVYPSAYWSFTFCSKKYHPLDDFDHERYKKLARKMKNDYYNNDIHFGSFALPEFVRRAL